MERLWSLAVATGGNPWQMEAAENGSHKRKFVAVGCVQLPESFHGKEGVDRSRRASVAVDPFTTADGVNLDSG
jgi:hypothetical protein